MFTVHNTAYVIFPLEYCTHTRTITYIYTSHTKLMNTAIKHRCVASGVCTSSTT